MDSAAQDAKGLAAANNWLDEAGHPEEGAAEDSAEIMGHIHTERSNHEQEITNYLMTSQGIKELLGSSNSELAVADAHYVTSAAESGDRYSAFEYSSAALYEFLKKQYEFQDGFHEVAILSYLVERRRMVLGEDRLWGVRGLLISLIAQLVEFMVKKGYTDQLAFLGDDKEYEFDHARGKQHTLKDLYHKLLSELNKKTTIYIITDLHDMIVNDRRSNEVLRDILETSQYSKGVPVKIFTTLPMEDTEIVRDYMRAITIDLGEETDTVELRDVHEGWRKALKPPLEDFAEYSDDEITDDEIEEQMRRIRSMRIRSMRIRNYEHGPG